MFLTWHEQWFGECEKDHFPPIYFQWKTSGSGSVCGVQWSISVQPSVHIAALHPPTHPPTTTPSVLTYSCIAPAPLSLLQHTVYHTALYHTTSYCATSHQVVSKQAPNPVLTQPAPNCTTWAEVWILQCAVCHWVQCSIIRAQWYRTSSGSGRNPPPLPPTKPPPHHLHLLPSHHHHPLKHHHHHLHPPHPHLHLSQ